MGACSPFSTFLQIFTVTSYEDYIGSNLLSLSEIMPTGPLYHQWRSKLGLCLNFFNIIRKCFQEFLKISSRTVGFTKDLSKGFSNLQA